MNHAYRIITTAVFVIGCTVVGMSLFQSSGHVFAPIAAAIQGAGK